MRPIAKFIKKHSPAIRTIFKQSLLYALLIASTQAYGDVVITEIMQNPNAVTDAKGEWFEVLNTGASAVNLNGWTIRDNDRDSHVIAQNLNIDPGAYAVLGRNGNQASNGGVIVHYTYSGVILGNGADEIVLVQPGGTIADTVTYDGGAAWPDPTGASMTLSSALADNNVGANWEAATDVFGSGDRGTPGSGPDGGAPGGNQAPVVNAGNDQSVVLSGTAVNPTLTGTASDPDGDPLTTQWTLHSGNAASVSIASPSQLSTTVTISAIGQYRFQLRADDNQTSSTDLVVVNVTDNNNPPPAGNYNIYFGNTHSHSEYSDGNKGNLGSFMDAASGFRYARNNGGLDWIIMSDHNHSMAGMILSNFHLGRSEASTVDAESANFTAIYGTEWGTIRTNSRPDGHVITVSPDLLGWQSGNYDVFIARSDYDALFKQINKINSFAELAHPHSGDYGDIFNNPYNAIWDQAISLISVKSGPAFAQETDYSNPSRSTTQTRYYDLLLKGYHLGPTSDQDTHYANWGLANEQRTAVLATENSRTAILDGLTAGRTYAVEDRNIAVEFTASYNGQTYHIADTVAISTGTTVTFTVNVTDPDAGDSISKIELRQGTVGGSSVSNATTVTSGSLTWDVTPTTARNQFYLLRITQADGQKAWSAPIWLDSTGASVAAYIPKADASTTMQ